MNCLKCFLNFTEKRIDCAKAEEGLKTTPNSECALNALAIDNPVKYARLYLDGTMQMWIDAEDSMELFFVVLYEKINKVSIFYLKFY